jgi:peptidoglycan/LPS O-acetylase OafA/YrhL
MPARIAQSQISMSGLESNFQSVDEEKPMVRKNGFDMLRVIAALFVIIGHSFALTGNFAPQILGTPVQTFGLKIFFVISGYLVALSWCRERNLMKFITKRVLRIMPGLVGAVVFCVIIVGPTFTSISISDYV